jgi:endoribonuclease Dicer
MSMFIPAILYRIESILIALDGCALLGLEIGSDLALEAMTKDSDNTEEHGTEQVNFQGGMGNNYERLEFLGDSFLKMATTISLFTLLPDNDEAQNHDERMLLVCNQNLFNHAADRSLFEYVRSRSFDRRTWYPQLKQRKGKAQTNELRHNLADKTIADVCEALIGGAYLSSQNDNLDMAVRAVTCMVKSKYHTMNSFKEYYEKYEAPAWQLVPGPAAYFATVDHVATAIGYKFQWPPLLRSAFKHPSYPYEAIPDYQRLEFLGDALLDMTMVDYLFRTFPGADPQWLTEHKMAMASNQFLGCLCVKLGLSKSVLVTTTALSGQIVRYTEELKQVEVEAQVEAQQNGEIPRPDFWLNASQPPKILPDVIESIVGAMFVDSKYDYSVVQRFFDQHVKPYFADMRLYDTFAQKHPVTGLGRRMVEFGCTRWRLCCSGMPSFCDDNVASVMNDKDGEVICALMVHGNVLMHNMAKSGRYGKVRLAKMALEEYNEENGWDAQKWRAETGCDCSGDDLQDDASLEDHGTAV